MSQHDASESVRSAGESPLAEADPNSLALLFSTNPLDLSDSQIEEVVAKLRAARRLWLTAEAAGATRAPKAPKAPKPPKAAAAAASEELKDLGLF